MANLVIFGDSDMAEIEKIFEQTDFKDIVTHADSGLKKQPTVEGSLVTRKIFEYIDSADKYKKHLSKKFIEKFRNLSNISKDKQEIIVYEGDLKDDIKKYYIYDSDNKEVGIILDAYIEQHKKKEIITMEILNPRVTPNYLTIFRHKFSFLNPKDKSWYKYLHTGNVLLLNINGIKKFYFVIQDRNNYYCVNYSLVTDYISNKIKGGIELIISPASESLIKSELEKLDEIDLPEYTESYTINQKLTELLNNASNSDLRLTEDEVNEINKRLHSSDLPEFNPDKLGYGRKKESRKKGRRKAMPSPKGKPMPKGKPKATKKRKNKRRKTK